jgi:hypothetical protein
MHIYTYECILLYQSSVNNNNPPSSQQGINNKAQVQEVNNSGRNGKTAVSSLILVFP